MRVIIGYGNELRGEDSFGIEVIKELKKLPLDNTRLISAFQLTPEMVLELLEAYEIIFIDASFNEDNQYALACSTTQQNSLSLTHHISPKSIIYMLNNLYNRSPEFFIYSMMTNSFNKIKDKEEYENSIKLLSTHLVLIDNQEKKCN